MNNNSVLLQNFRKNDTINQEIYDRNFPSNNLQMNFSPRPVQTKYSVFPILDHKPESKVPITNCQIYNTSDTFFPGTRQPHFNGFSSNIDNESTLRNQFFALQNADQAKYIPSTTSDMYDNSINFLNTNVDLDNTLLFNQEEFNDFNPNLAPSIGSNIFNNSTRVQLKNL